MFSDIILVGVIPAIRLLFNTPATCQNTKYIARYWLIYMPWINATHKGWLIVLCGYVCVCVASQQVKIIFNTLIFIFSKRWDCVWAELILYCQLIWYFSVYFSKSFELIYRYLSDTVYRYMLDTVLLYNLFSDVTN